MTQTEFGDRAASFSRRTGNFTMATRLRWSYGVNRVVLDEIFRPTSPPMILVQHRFLPPLADVPAVKDFGQASLERLHQEEPADGKFIPGEPASDLASRWAETLYRIAGDELMQRQVGSLLLAQVSLSLNRAVRRFQPGAFPLDSISQAVILASTAILGGEGAADAEESRVAITTAITDRFDRWSDLVLSRSMASMIRALDPTHDEQRAKLGGLLTGLIEAHPIRSSEEVRQGEDQIARQSRTFRVEMAKGYLLAADALINGPIRESPKEWLPAVDKNLQYAIQAGLRLQSPQIWPALTYRGAILQTEGFTRPPPFAGQAEFAERIELPSSDPISN